MKPLVVSFSPPLLIGQPSRQLQHLQVPPIREWGEGGLRLSRSRFLPRRSDKRHGRARGPGTPTQNPPNPPPVRPPKPQSIPAHGNGLASQTDGRELGIAAFWGPVWGDMEPTLNRAPLSSPRPFNEDKARQRHGVSYGEAQLRAGAHVVSKASKEARMSLHPSAPADKMYRAPEIWGFRGYKLGKQACFGSGSSYLNPITARAVCLCLVQPHTLTSHFQLHSAVRAQYNLQPSAVVHWLESKLKNRRWLGQTSSRPPVHPSPGSGIRPLPFWHPPHIAKSRA